MRRATYVHLQMLKGLDDHRVCSLGRDLADHPCLDESLSLRQEDVAHWVLHASPQCNHM